MTSFSSDYGSLKRVETLNACAFRYWFKYHFMAEHDGPGIRFHSPMRYLTTLQEATDQILQKCIRNALRTYIKSQSVPPLDRLIEQARSEWTIKEAESNSGEWSRQPLTVCNLMEDHYDVEDLDARITAARLRTNRCLATFTSSQLWQQLEKVNRQHWLFTNDLPREIQNPRMITDGLHGLLMVDNGTDDGNTKNGRFLRLLSERNESAINSIRSASIIDWKTGMKQNGDEMRLAYFALLAHRVWHIPIEAMTAKIVYLFPHEEVEVPITRDFLNFAFQQLNDDRLGMPISFDRDMTAPMGHEMFPPTDNPDVCRPCQFRALCPQYALIRDESGIPYFEPKWYYEMATLSGDDTLSDECEDMKFYEEIMEEIESDSFNE